MLHLQEISLPIDHLLASEPNHIVAMDFTISGKASDSRENVLVKTDVIFKFTWAILTRDHICIAHATAKVMLQDHEAVLDLSLNLFVG